MKWLICSILVFVFLGFASAATVFYDGFESGSFVGWNMSTSWAGNNWTVNQTDPYAGNWSAESNPQDNHINVSVIEKGISTFGYDNITFSYYRKLVGLDASNTFRVRWFNGTGWNYVENTNTTINDSNYSLMSFVLPASAWNNYGFKIRFECSANAQNEYCRVDDVLVTGDPINLLPNYVGSFDYMPGQTYSVFVDQNAQRIVFTGANVSNQNSVFIVPYNYQGFSKRVNYVWFSGWFDNQSLYMNQYVGTGAQYLTNISVYYASGYYTGQIYLPNSVYMGINIPILVGLAVSLPTGQTTFNPYSYSGALRTSFIDNSLGVAGHSYGAVLYQTKLLNNSINDSTLEVTEWVKEDLASNGLNPRWTVPLTAI